MALATICPSVSSSIARPSSAALKPNSTGCLAAFMKLTHWLHLP